MVIKGVTRLLLASLMLFPAAVGWGAEIHGRSSTQLLWYNNEFVDGRQFEAAEYLRVGITNIDKAGKLSLYGYGRLSQDFTKGEALNGRLYYLYADYRDLYDKVDFKLGRQFVNLAAGSAIIDGLQVDLKNVGPVGFTLLGGRDVLFGLNGEIGNGGNADLGLAAYLTGFKNTDAEISWFRKWDRSDVARDVLGASFKQYLFNSIRVYGNARFDLVSETFNEVQAGLKYYPLSNLVFTGEYYQSYPTFDTTSIYSVFAVNQYQEGLFRVDYAINDMVSVNGGYSRQGYGEGAAANVYHLGTGIRPIEQLKLNVEYDNRQGYYGSTNGVIVDADLEINKNAQVAAGFQYDVYQRDSLTNDEIARRYWIGGKYKLTKALAVSGRIQDDVNARFTENITGRLVFDYDF
ncbi:hypothetical protein [Geobacter argillaceus]|uniref:Porin n=1 Tax=Geobacter argillaceus TaxID=345631 RepID=A0A562WR75_9BACT|nr:hypothetical protein [Geobacter argillaceus]TWJ32909.1 hypothetical protein JN12_00319 [Geobacter argillaceus]